MNYDPEDEYQIHAYMALGYSCSDCTRDLEINSVHEMASDEWCVEAAAQARSEGWYVPSISKDGQYDVETNYCADCASRRGLAISRSRAST
jgi:hypothetical protein